jgi:putative FmdB family regulatory protein
MPTYDYECNKCGHKFEAFQSIKAEPLKTCPICKKNNVRRLIGAGAGIIFKGSGFYCTDYRDGNYKTAAGNDKPKTDSTAATETKTETKSETKTETKSESKPQSTSSNTESKAENKKKT